MILSAAPLSLSLRLTPNHLTLREPHRSAPGGLQPQPPLHRDEAARAAGAGAPREEVPPALSGGHGHHQGGLPPSALDWSACGMRGVSLVGGASDGLYTEPLFSVHACLPCSGRFVWTPTTDPPVLSF